MSELKNKSNPDTANIFAGLGIGLLVGLIVGLSVSPVVSIVLGALVSLLAAFLGLQENTAAPDVSTDAKAGNFLSRMQMNSLKAGSFGFACIIGILLGLFIRTNDVFSPSLKQQIATYHQAGYDVDYARQLIIFEKFGIGPDFKVIQDGDTQKNKRNVLFAGKSEIDLCQEISMERYGNNVSEVLKGIRRLENKKLTQLADAIDEIDISSEDKETLMTAVSEGICELQ